MTGVFQGDWDPLRGVAGPVAVMRTGLHLGGSPAIRTGSTLPVGPRGAALTPRSGGFGVPAGPCGSRWLAAGSGGRNRSRVAGVVMSKLVLPGSRVRLSA
ncbi:hypothetical protein GCM10023074_44990 [Microbispora amethystogenes]|uniref:Uncharacterized protein n=1 Tax=Microbispora amethystogenes TaxID=1427754 RepID=A0ABQ4FJ77_9ACTN|nr:hypothetical protein Mam01_50090 [Microbispora amethystogenes]